MSFLAQPSPEDSNASQGAPLRVLVPAFGLFLFGLSVPVVSTIALAVTGGLALTGLLHHRFLGGFLARAALLVLFFGSYLIICRAHGIGSLGSGLKFGGLAVSAYAVGYAAGSRANCSWFHQLAGLLAVVVGACLFAALGVREAIASAQAFAIVERAAPNVWGAADAINAPVVGAMAAPALCLAPLLLFGRREGLPFAWIWTLIVALASLAAAYVNLALSNRTPFIALALSVIAAAGIYLRSANVFSRSVALRALLLLAFAYVLATFGSFGQIHDLALFQRFERQGFETARFETWATMLAHLLDAPGGGHVVYLFGQRYVHNLWLDTAYDAGLLPFILLIAFHAVHVPALFRALSRKQRVNLRLVLVGTGLALLATSVAEPVLEMSMTFFPMSTYYLGLVLGLATTQAQK
jgi:hypothetical protein